MNLKKLLSMQWVTALGNYAFKSNLEETKFVSQSFPALSPYIYNGYSLESRGSVYFILCITFFVQKRLTTVHCLVQQKTSVLAYIECVTANTVQTCLCLYNSWVPKGLLWVKVCENLYWECDATICISCIQNTHAHTVYLSVIVNMK